MRKVGDFSAEAGVVNQPLKSDKGSFVLRNVKDRFRGPTHQRATACVNEVVGHGDRAHNVHSVFVHTWSTCLSNALSYAGRGSERKCQFFLSSRLPLNPMEAPMDCRSHLAAGGTQVASL